MTSLKKIRKRRYSSSNSANILINENSLKIANYLLRENIIILINHQFDVIIYFQTAFDDVLAEVDGTHSIDCIWKASYACFHGCKSCCYNIFTFFCGIWIACFWGLDFALISFAHVWCVTPILRMCMIHFNLCQKTFGTWVNCCCAPCCEVFSLIFSNIRVEKR